MKVLLFLLLIVRPAISQSQTTYPDAYLTTKFKGIIFGKTQNPFCRSSAFDLTRAQILEAEKCISNNLDSLVDYSDLDSVVKVKIKSKFYNYKRQYFGCIRNSSKKTIIITFDYVDNMDTINWNYREIMQCSDCGDNHWAIEYDFASKKLSSLFVAQGGG